MTTAITSGKGKDWKRWQTHEECSQRGAMRSLFAKAMGVECAS
jgi:hypothetical protein